MTTATQEEVTELEARVAKLRAEATLLEEIVAARRAENVSLCQQVRDHHARLPGRVAAPPPLAAPAAIVQQPDRTPAFSKPWAPILGAQAMLADGRTGTIQHIAGVHAHLGLRGGTLVVPLGLLKDPTAPPPSAPPPPPSSIPIVEVTALDEPDEEPTTSPAPLADLHPSSVDLAVLVPDEEPHQ